MFSVVLVCLFVNITQKFMNGLRMTFYGGVRDGNRKI